jgi:hypothetical protein
MADSLSLIINQTTWTSGLLLKKLTLLEIKSESRSSVKSGSRFSLTEDRLLVTGTRR